MRTGAALRIVLVVAALPVALLFVPRDAPASHATFHHAFGRVEIDGNTFGPFDGAADFVDEFNNGSIAPWTPDGTVVEIGGAMHLVSPGTHNDTFGLDFSQATMSGSPFVNGAGSFTATARIVTGVPPANQQVIFLFGALLDEVLAIVVQHSSVLQVYIAGAIVDPQTHSIGPSDVAGDIVLRISFWACPDSVDTCVMLLASSPRTAARRQRG